MTFLALFTLFITTATQTAAQEFTGANNLFTKSVYQEILENEEGNFFISPFSAETILTLILTGAENETADELRTALYLPDSLEAVQEELKNLQPVFDANSSYTLQSANKIYIRPDLQTHDSFKSVAKAVFRSEVENIDFSKNEEAANAINSWVESQTGNKIKQLVDASQLDQQTEAVLVNALYFKGAWAYQFSKDLTSKESFYKNSTDVTQVETMRNKLSVKYYEDSVLQVQYLELPFEGGNISMTIVLPREEDGLSTLENHLEQVFHSPQYSFEEVIITLPKFKIETKVNFTEILQTLGVSRLFQPGLADLNGISENKSNISVSGVFQKTFIDVAEGGVEATVANATIGMVDSALMPIPKEFIADHPFVFYIKVKDLIIFAGRVIDPHQ